MSCEYCGKDAVIIVALGVLPQYQGSSVGTSLIEKVEAEAKRMLVLRCMEGTLFRFRWRMPLRWVKILKE